MKVSKQGLDLIKKHEGLRLEPYLCPAGVPTIGYGNTYYLNGERVTMSDTPITFDYANELLKSIVKRFEDGVNRYVQVKLTQNQFDALVSLAYNIGLNAFRRSTLLKRINKRSYDYRIAYEFSRWNKSGGRVLRGLIKRRSQEANLYFS